MIDLNVENMAIHGGEGFNPMVAPVIHSLGVPSRWGHIVMGLIAILPTVPIILLGLLWKGGEK